MNPKRKKVRYMFGKKEMLKWHTVLLIHELEILDTRHRDPTAEVEDVRPEL